MEISTSASNHGSRPAAATANLVATTRQPFAKPSVFAVLAMISLIYLALPVGVDSKDLRKEMAKPQSGVCIARFESNTGEPLYYNCPKPNEPANKTYCCYLDKCCDFKEFRTLTEKKFKMTNPTDYGYIAKGAIGKALKFLLWIIFIIILSIVACCCLSFFLCRKKKLFQGGIFSSPLPAQPPGPSPYARPANPYMAYQWPPETAPPAPGMAMNRAAAAPPAYPQPSYPPYPSANGAQPQPPYNPHFK